MDVTALVTAAVAMLAPYFGKAAEAIATKAGESAGESAMEGAGRLYRWLNDKLTRAGAAETLQDLRAQPQDGDLQAALRVHLRRALETEPRLADELADLLRDIAVQADAVSQTQHVSGDEALGIQVAGDGNAVSIR